jgi:hypothetical protein
MTAMTQHDFLEKMFCFCVGFEVLTAVVMQSCCLHHAGFLLGLLFGTEDGRRPFFLIVG